MNLKSARTSFVKKTKVGQLARAAISRGEIKRQPCEKCSAEFAHAHHEDYGKPLDVTWLCPKCHVQRHREIRAELGIKIVGYGYRRKYIYPKQEAA